MEPYDSVSAMLLEVRRLDNAAKQYAGAMAELLAGKLRSVDDLSVLRALKKELADYNIHTGKWKA